jgi:hypothetical protein
MYEYIILDGNKYAVVQGTYVDNWSRAFSFNMLAQVVRLNFVDRGPGIHKYTMTLELRNWPQNSDLYQAGITTSAIQQYNALAASFLKTSTLISYTDPLGQSSPPGGAFANGVYFTMFNLVVPAYSTASNPALQAQIELTNSSGPIV